MQELELSGRKFRTGKLDAFKQFHLVRKLLPLFSGMGESFAQMPAQVGTTDFWHSLAPVAQAISEMTMADSEWIIKTCLAAASLYNGRSWVPVTTPQGDLMFEDIEMSDMLQLSFAVIQDNLGSFFPVAPANGLDTGAPQSASITPQ